MAAERKNGAGSFLGGVLEQARPPKPEPTVEPEPATAEPNTRGRGASSAPKASRAPASRAAKRVRGRTVYLPDDLFERIIVQAHRKDLTISDYIAALLERHVPDHRVVRSGSSSSIAEPESEEAA
jgi:hypothetical protein